LGQARGIGVSRRAVIYYLSLRTSGEPLGGQLGLIILGLRRALRPVIRDWLRVADRLGQHQTQLILAHRRLPRGR
jgi:hypothetical protein